MSEARFAFSIMMAVYNVAPYLAEAVDSLRVQTIGFDRVQLILVDDGSTDGSGELCDTIAAAEPEHIIALHKENGGQASARNMGLAYAEGQYINFMDADDKLSRNTLADVQAFFEKHGEETDLVAIPMYLFGAQSGPHWQNTKFDRGDRVISLLQEYKVQQSSTSSTFYHSRVKPLICFDEQLPNNEDFKVNLTLLAHKPTLGVVRSCRYMYRKRPAGNSTVDSMTLKKSWYFDWYTHMNDWAYAYFTEHFGFYPAFAQYGVLCDLLWRYLSQYDQAMALTLNGEEQQQYIEATAKAMQYFDDCYIMELPKLRMSHKLLMLRHKYGRLPDVTPLNDTNLLLHYGNTNLIDMASLYTQLDFLRIEQGVMTVEGFVNLLGLDEAEEAEVFLTDGTRDYPCDTGLLGHRTQMRLGMQLHRSLGFRAVIELNA